MTHLLPVSKVTSGSSASPLTQSRRMWRLILDLDLIPVVQPDRTEPDRTEPDRTTGVILLRGMNRKDVYRIPTSLTFQANFINKTSISDWHRRLGHPAMPIMQQVTNKLGLSFSTFQNKTICAS